MSATSVHSILVIDDDREDYDMVSEVVASIDPSISVSFLCRCEDAETFKGQHFDFILLDINMPVHDGFSWLSGIRKRGHTLPVIMYTNSSKPANIVKAYTEGATLYFTKPETYTHLLQGLQKLLQLDWSDPLSIKSRYANNGKYSTFNAG